MSTTLSPPPRIEPRPNYLNVDYGWRSWLFTTDHKRIALLYLFSITAFFFVGGIFAVMMRINLLQPEGVSVTIHTTSCSLCTGLSWSSSSWSRRFPRHWEIF
jgi:hypothetical protein